MGNPFTISSSATSGIAAIGEVIKRVKRLKGKFEIEFNNYCSVSLSIVSF